MAYELSRIQRQLLLQALDCIREDLRPGLSPRQTLVANRIADCVSQVLEAHPPATPTHPRTDPGGKADPLQAALGRLDVCIDRNLREGRLSAESRLSLHAELQTAAQILARPHAVPGPDQAGRA